jgi:tetratricopeptide (TPR) repeat protein
VRGAVELFTEDLGGYHTFNRTGGYARGLRIAERFLPQDDFSRLESILPKRVQSRLINAFALFASNIGDLDRSRRALTHGLKLKQELLDPMIEATGAHNLADLELWAGNFPRAREYAESAVFLDTGINEPWETASSLSARAAAHAAMGENDKAAADFCRAAEVEGRPLNSYRGIREAEFKYLCGYREEALRQTHANREEAVTKQWEQISCRCDALLVHLLLSDDVAAAARHLQEARTFNTRASDIEFQLRCFHSACELHRHLGDHSQSITEAEAGILLADTCGFGKFAIDLRLALAETLLAAGDPTKALKHAREALDRSLDPECQYAWGQADGLHLTGVAHLRLSEPELARQRLTVALELRERLGHRSTDVTRKALDIIPS